MKLFFKKIQLLVIMGLILGVFSSFSNPTKEKETLLRNIEALSRGEGSSVFKCIVDIGVCPMNGIIYQGMTIKK